MTKAKNPNQVERRGGPRPGAGAPAKEPTVVLSYRVPEKQAGGIDEKIKAVIKRELKKSKPG